MRKPLLIFIAALLMGGLELSVSQGSHGDSLEGLHSALPHKIGGWIAEPQDRIYDRKTIFDYIDGEGEVYRAYNMKVCLSRRYAYPGGPPIVVDIFEMGSSKDAFGVFTHDQDGEPVDVGQGGIYRSGWLSFWKGPFFVSIYAEEETPGSKKAVGDLASLLASLIKAQGTKPQVLGRLPSQGLQPRSIRYLHDATVLNYHFYLADQNILGLGPDTDAALAEYSAGHEHALLLLVMYPSEAKAAEAHASLMRTYLSKSDSTASILLENGKWSAATVRDNLVATVLEADTRQLAEGLLKRVMETQQID